MTSKEDAVSREAPASLEARFTADRSTFSKNTLLFNEIIAFVLNEGKMTWVKLT